MDINQMVGLAFAPLALPLGLSEKTLISMTRIYPYWPQILLACFLLLTVFFLVKSIVDAVRARRKREGGPAPRDVRRRVAGRLALLAMAAYVLWRLSDLYWVWLHRWPILLLLGWLFSVGITTWIFGRWGRRGMIEAVGIYHLIGTALIAGFLFTFHDYRPAVPLLALLIVAVNGTVFLRRTVAARLAFKILHWPAAFLFAAFVFAPFILHPALRVARDLPRFGAVTVVPGTEGMAIQEVAISRTGRMLYFTAKGKDRGLGRLNLMSDNSSPMFDHYGFSDFSDLIRYQPGNILAAGAKSRAGGEILLFQMDPPKQIGRFTLPIHTLDNTAIEEMVTTRKWMFASVSSDDGAYLLTCPFVGEENTGDVDLQARCVQTPMEYKRPGTLAASDFLNRVLFGASASPLGISREAMELLALILKEKGPVEFSEGALVTQYGEKNRRLLIGRPFQKGIDLIDTDNLEVITTLPGPLAVNVLYNREQLLVAGSYLEGQIVIWNMKSLIFRYVNVGPGVTDIDYCQGLNDLFVATSVGVMRVDLDLLFDPHILW